MLYRDIVKKVIEENPEDVKGFISLVKKVEKEIEGNFSLSLDLIISQLKKDGLIEE